MTSVSLKDGAQIRVMTVEDWPAVRTIYQEGIDTGEATFETNAPAWADWDGNHLPSPRLVATTEQHVIGWATLSPVSKRLVYAGVAETSVYIAGDWRGKGIGRALLAALITESESANIWTLQASIFAENVASVRLHEQCGFRAVGTRERIARLNGIWRSTLLLERRSLVVES